MLTFFEDCCRGLHFALPSFGMSRHRVRSTSSHRQEHTHTHIPDHKVTGCTSCAALFLGLPHLVSDFALSVSVKNTLASNGVCLRMTCRSVGCSGLLINRVSHAAHEFTGRFSQLRAKYEFLHFRPSGGVTMLRVAAPFGFQRHSKKCGGLQCAAVQKPPRSWATRIRSARSQKFPPEQVEVPHDPCWEHVESRSLSVVWQELGNVLFWRSMTSSLRSGWRICKICRRVRMPPS